MFGEKDAKVQFGSSEEQGALCSHDISRAKRKLDGKDREREKSFTFSHFDTAAAAAACG